MNTPGVKDVTVKVDAQAAKERPEVAAVLLQRLQSALGAGREAGASWRPGQEGMRAFVRSDGYSEDMRAFVRSNGCSEDMRAFVRSDGYSEEMDTRALEEPPAGNSIASIGAPSLKDTSNNAPPAERAAHPALADELLTLLEGLKTGVYVGDRSRVQQRVLLTLESALPGAAAEIVRDGAHLIIRLHASNETAFRTMLAQREALDQSLKERDLPNVTIELMPVSGALHARRE